MQKTRIGITMGDPAGVGPELILRVLSEPAFQSAYQLIVFGDAAILQHCAEKTGISMPPYVVVEPDQFAAGNCHPDHALVVDLHRLQPGQFEIAKVNSACGQASFDYIQASIDASLQGQIDAVVTAPINKEALHAAGITYPGHTEMFAERADSSRWCMMQYSQEITCTFVTVHVGYSEVPSLLTTARILDTIELTAEALRKIRGHEPKLLVCGLNPHAGENGLFGNGEEERCITPAVLAARQQGIHIEGPLPPDTAFLPWKRKTSDAVVCMYHDQGHIPLKALAFDSAVNTTLGLKIVRTSVDHGTAYDIAWQAKANSGSLLAAVRLAAQLASQR